MGVYQKARAATKNRIKQKFWALYKENRINKITVRQVAEAAGIHRATFYIHYKDVYEIIEEIEDELLADLKGLDISDADSEAGLIKIGKVYFDEYRDKWDYLHILVREQRDSLFASKYRDAMIQKMLRAFQRDDSRQTPLQKKIVGMTVSQIADVCIGCSDDKAISFEDMTKLMMGFMSKGFYRTMSEDFDVKGLINPL